MMSLTVETLTTLKRAFPSADHEFINGFVYLSEGAITNRLEEVDPAWSFEIRHIVREGDQCVCYARLTVCDTSRDGIGMQTIITKDGKTIGEAEKGAATDALKRCARLFGVGRYLLDSAPKEGKAFDSWLAAQQNGNGKPAALPTPAPSVSTASPNNGASGSSLSEAIFNEMADKRSDAIKNAVAEGGEFVCSNIERKKKDKTEWLVFFDDADDKTFATAFSRESVTGLHDALTLPEYEALKTVGVHAVSPSRITWKWDKERKFRTACTAELALADVPF